MDAQTKLLDFNFSEYKFADIKLERCTLKEYLPAQDEKITVSKGCTFIIILNGKGTLSSYDKRFKLIKGYAALVPHGYSVQVKSDTLEPLTAILLKLNGDALKSIISTIERKENGILMNISDDTKIAESAMDILTECSKPYHSDFSILYKFFEFINNLELHYSDKKIPSKNAYMARAIEYIEQNYNKNISVESIADLLGIERSYLSRLFKTYKNKSTQNYIIDFRINRAKRLFEEEDMNVSQVSAAVGYTNIYCFSRIFKSRVGIPPKEYMENCKRKSL